MNENLNIFNLKENTFYIVNDENGNKNNLYYIDTNRALYFICEENNYRSVKPIVDYNDIINWKFKLAPSEYVDHILSLQKKENI